MHDTIHRSKVHIKFVSHHWPQRRVAFSPSISKNPKLSKDTRSEGSDFYFLSDFSRNESEIIAHFHHLLFGASVTRWRNRICCDFCGRFRAQPATYHRLYATLKYYKYISKMKNLKVKWDNFICNKIYSKEEEPLSSAITLILHHQIIRKIKIFHVFNDSPITVFKLFSKCFFLFFFCLFYDILF